MEPGSKVRIDKWLFAMRLFKTRSLAVEFCDRERVAVGDQVVKPSRLLKEGDEITLSRTGFKQVFKVLKLTDKRLSAKLVAEYYLNITTQEDLDKMELLKAQKVFSRDKGTGRPTKRERRDLDEFSDW